MKDMSMYRRLAADGNKDAQIIVDAVEESEGAEPAEEMAEAESEQQELEDLRKLATEVGRLVGKAEIHTEKGEHADAGDAHFELGGMHEKAGDHAKAKDSFKAAATSYRTHITDLCSMSPEQIQAWHARENAEKRVGDDEDDGGDEEDGCICGCRGCECGCERGGTCVCSSRCSHAGG